MALTRFQKGSLRGAKVRGHSMDTALARFHKGSMRGAKLRGTRWKACRRNGVIGWACLNINILIHNFITLGYHLWLS